MTRPSWFTAFEPCKTQHVYLGNAYLDSQLPGAHYATATGAEDQTRDFWQRGFNNENSALQYGVYLGTDVSVPQIITEAPANTPAWQYDPSQWVTFDGHVQINTMSSPATQVFGYQNQGDIQTEYWNPLLDLTPVGADDPRFKLVTMDYRSAFGTGGSTLRMNHQYCYISGACFFFDIGTRTNVYNFRSTDHATLAADGLPFDYSQLTNNENIDGYHWFDGQSVAMEQGADGYGVYPVVKGPSLNIQNPKLKIIISSGSTVNGTSRAGQEPQARMRTGNIDWRNYVPSMGPHYAEQYTDNFAVTDTFYVYRLPGSMCNANYGNRMPFTTGVSPAAAGMVKIATITIGNGTASITGCNTVTVNSWGDWEGEIAFDPTPYLNSNGRFGFAIIPSWMVDGCTYNLSMLWNSMLGYDRYYASNFLPPGSAPADAFCPGLELDWTESLYFRTYVAVTFEFDVTPPAFRDKIKSLDNTTPAIPSPAGKPVRQRYVATVGETVLSPGVQHPWGTRGRYLGPLTNELFVATESFKTRNLGIFGAEDPNDYDTFLNLGRITGTGWESLDRIYLCAGINAPVAAVNDSGAMLIWGTQFYRSTATRYLYSPRYSVTYAPTDLAQSFPIYHLHIDPIAIDPVFGDPVAGPPSWGTISKEGTVLLTERGTFDVASGAYRRPLPTMSAEDTLVGMPLYWMILTVPSGYLLPDGTVAPNTYIKLWRESDGQLLDVLPVTSADVNLQNGTWVALDLGAAWVYFDRIAHRVHYRYLYAGNGMLRWWGPEQSFTPQWEPITVTNMDTQPAVSAWMGQIAVAPAFVSVPV